MFNRKLFIITLALASMFLIVVAAQAQDEPSPVEINIATNLRYLETYNIPELRYDPLWHRAMNPAPEYPAMACVNKVRYLATYGIEDLYDDPLWREAEAEFVVAMTTPR